MSARPVQPHERRRRLVGLGLGLTRLGPALVGGLVVAKGCGGPFDVPFRHFAVDDVGVGSLAAGRVESSAEPSEPVACQCRKGEKAPSWAMDLRVMPRAGWRRIVLRGLLFVGIGPTRNDGGQQKLRQLCVHDVTLAKGRSRRHFRVQPRGVADRPEPRRKVALPGSRSPCSNAGPATVVYQPSVALIEGGIEPCPLLGGLTRSGGQRRVKHQAATPMVGPLGVRGISKSGPNST